jgi:hypothetical protein
MAETRPLVFGLITSIFCTLGVSTETKADAFSKYTELLSMQCIGERGVIKFTAEDDLISILGDDPMTLKVDGQAVKKNGDKQQYLISLGFMEYFISFEDTRVVVNLMGMKEELQCY